jgi:predicted enzyme related to lactoylglutathione lyase
MGMSVLLARSTAREAIGFAARAALALVRRWGTIRASVRARKKEGGMASPFVHLELTTNDVSKAKEFYAGLFDWKLEDTTMADGDKYTMIRPGEGPGGGMMKNPMPGAASAWLPYVQVADVASSTRKAKDLGGTIYKDKTDIPGMGAFSIVADPTGAVIGLWQAAAK